MSDAASMNVCQVAGSTPLPVLPMTPLYHNPAGYWDKAGRRVVNVFHRDKPGVEVLQIIGDGTDADAYARFLIAASEKQQRNMAPACIIEVPHG